MKNNKNTRAKSTKRNKGLEPTLLGTRGAIGYIEEIHEEDAIEFSYKLPLGAIKRLIRSYYEEMLQIDSDYIYYTSSGSYETRMHEYCYSMILELRKQLDEHGLDWKKINNEVFDRYIKKDREKMQRYSKNHSEQNPYEKLKPCKDPECCDQAGN